MRLTFLDCLLCILAAAAAGLQQGKAASTTPRSDGLGKHAISIFPGGSFRRKQEMREEISSFRIDESDSTDHESEGSASIGDDDDDVGNTGTAAFVGAGNTEAAGSRGGSCEQEYIVEGDWCEECCATPTDPLAQAAGMKPGTCIQQGFVVNKGIMALAAFAPSNSTLRDAGQFTIPADCNPHYLIKNNICEGFCAGSDPKMLHYVDHRTGIRTGTCFDNGFPKYVGKGKLTAFVSSSVHDKFG